MELNELQTETKNTVKSNTIFSKIPKHISDSLEHSMPYEEQLAKAGDSLMKTWSENTLEGVSIHTELENTNEATNSEDPPSLAQVQAPQATGSSSNAEEAIEQDHSSADGYLEDALLEVQTAAGA